MATFKGAQNNLMHFKGICTPNSSSPLTAVGPIPKALKVHALRIHLNGNFFTETVKLVLPPTTHPERQISFKLLTNSAVTVWKTGFIDPYL